MRPCLPCAPPGLVFLLTISLSAQNAAPAGPDVNREIAIVKQHMAARELREALAFVEKQQADPSAVVQDWLGVCNAYGPSGDEMNRSRHIYKMFRLYGLEQVYIDDYANVIAIRPGAGGGPKAVLTAHHDAVALWPSGQPIEAFMRDDRVYCPAAGDDLVGVVQLLTVLRAMNEGKVETKGDVWFVSFAGEETGSWGAENFARGHYPLNLDWRRGDAVVQLHGGAGVGVTTGSTPIINMATLRVFTPFERNVPGQEGADRRWRPHAVDALARIIVRIRTEITDKRSDCLRCTGEDEAADGAEWYVNMANIEASAIRNRPGSEAALRLDIRAVSTPQMRTLLERVQRIATEVCGELQSKGFPPHHYRERCSSLLQVDKTFGRDDTDPIPGWDKVNNMQARMVAAAGHVLYGFPPTIDPDRGCGDCSNMYKAGFPAMSFRGDVIDRGAGRVERGPFGRVGGHDVTESQAIHGLWAGIKHALVFAVSHAAITSVAQSRE